MTGPAWLMAALAVVMLAIACVCAARLAAAGRGRRPAEVDADAAHLVMGLAMAGMLVPRLGLLPRPACGALLSLAATWFAAQWLRGLVASPAAGAAARPWRSAHPAPHLVECAAMIYMLVVLPGPAAGRLTGMPGMAAAQPGGGLVGLAVVLAIFMVGYALWCADQLAARARAAAGAARAAASGRGSLAPVLGSCATIAMGATMGYMLLATV